jgi:hypothetical protein
VIFQLLNRKRARGCSLRTRFICLRRGGLEQFAKDLFGRPGLASQLAELEKEGICDRSAAHCKERNRIFP